MIFRVLNETEFNSIREEFDYNFYQSSGWTRIKKTNRWNHEYVAVFDNDKPVLVCVILMRKIIAKYLCYAPRGPLVADGADKKKVYEFFLKNVREHLKKKGGFVFTIDPYIEMRKHDRSGDVVGDWSNEEFVEFLKDMGCRHKGFTTGYSGDIQFRATFPAATSSLARPPVSAAPANLSSASSLIKGGLIVIFIRVSPFPRSFRLEPHRQHEEGKAVPLERNQLDRGERPVDEQLDLVTFARLERVEHVAAVEADLHVVARLLTGDLVVRLADRGRTGDLDHAALEFEPQGAFNIVRNEQGGAVDGGDQLARADLDGRLPARGDGRPVIEEFSLQQPGYYIITPGLEDNMSF